MPVINDSNLFAGTRGTADGSDPDLPAGWTTPTAAGASRPVRRVSRSNSGEAAVDFQNVFVTATYKHDHTLGTAGTPSGQLNPHVEPISQTEAQPLDGIPGNPVVRLARLSRAILV